MLAKPFRLNKDWRIKQVLKKGKTVHTKFFSLIYLPNKQNKTRAVIIVSKKYDKRAVYRNKLKRKYQEALYQPLSAWQSSGDVVILPKYQFDQVHFCDLQFSLEQILQKIG